MAKNRYYSVKTGRNPGIYTSWEEAKKQVEGYSGAIYKGFTNKEQAEAFCEINYSPNLESQKGSNKLQESYYNAFNERIEKKIACLNDNEVIAFVDGSYNEEAEVIGCGVIIFGKNRSEDRLYQSFKKSYRQDMLNHRNVAGELEAVKQAVNWAISHNKRRIDIYYDYEGIEKWATKEWKPKKSLTKEYAGFIAKVSGSIKINFIKVPAHNGIKYNEEADKLAREAISIKGFKTYKDGSVYFYGIKYDD